MIFESLRRLKQAGVLGMNGRNADYIMCWNPRSLFPLVDDKVLTRKLAESFQIPTPAIYHVVDRNGDVAGLREALRGVSEFAVKPARGSGGSGIVLIRECTENGYVTHNGELISPRIFFIIFPTSFRGSIPLPALRTGRFWRP